jgi:hypothetical protein
VQAAISAGHDESPAFQPVKDFLELSGTACNRHIDQSGFPEQIDGRPEGLAVRAARTDVRHQEYRVHRLDPTKHCGSTCLVSR